MRDRAQQTYNWSALVRWFVGVVANPVNNFDFVVGMARPIFG